jgi:hypothetical protein
METIIVQYVSENIYADTSKKEIKYLVQFCGVSDNPKKYMKLQVWEMPFDSIENAKETLNVYLSKIKKGSFIIISSSKKFALVNKKK